MSIILSKSTPVARKAHHCDALQYVLADYEDGMYTYAELRQIVKAKRQRGMILPGQRYLRIVQIYDGDFGVFRAIPEIDDICCKYDLYFDD